MLRTTLLLATLACGAVASAAGDATATCDRLDRSHRFEMHDTDIDLDGQDLVLRSGGVELIHIDAQRKLFVSGRAVSVPPEARAHLDAYVEGFRKLGDDAKQIGREGGRIAAHAVSGLVDVLFTSATIEDYQRAMESRGKDIEVRAELLCRTVVDLQRTERELQQRIPAFPTFISPVEPAL